MEKGNKKKRKRKEKTGGGVIQPRSLAFRFGGWREARGVGAAAPGGWRMPFLCWRRVALLRPGGVAGSRARIAGPVDMGRGGARAAGANGLGWLCKVCFGARWALLSASRMRPGTPWRLRGGKAPKTAMSQARSEDHEGQVPNLSDLTCSQRGRAVL